MQKYYFFKFPDTFTRAFECAVYEFHANGYVAYNSLDLTYVEQFAEMVSLT